MAFPLKSSKRPFESNPSASSGRAKWRKTAPNSQQAPFNVPPGAVIFRILCPVSKCGSVIGKGGSILTKIRKETGAKIKLEEILSGCEETVVVITGSDKDDEASYELAKERNEDSAGTDDPVNDKGSNKNDEEKGEGEDEEKVEEKDQKVKEEDQKVEEKVEPSFSELPKSEKVISSAQKALLLVFERIIADELENDGGNKESAVTVRLLILTSQVGCLLGKGGSVIKKMSSDSGAQIRILVKEENPSCASPHDEVVQIIGGADSAKKALQSVSQLLLENPPRDVLPAPWLSSHQFASMPRPMGISSANSVPVQRSPFSSRAYDGSGIPAPFAKFHESVAPGHIGGPSEQLIFRLLCSKDKVGSVIGKGGNIVKSIENETGTEIKVVEVTPESDDRIIVISGPALPGERISPVQDGVLRVHHRIVMAVPDDKESTVLSRLLVAANQIGCLVGKGGAVMTEMRNLSGAHIHILNKDQIIMNMPENDEVVQCYFCHYSATFTNKAVPDGVLRVHHRIVMAVPDDKESTVLSRLLVAANQIGCLVGKGGAVMTEMRNLSGAHIRILNKDQITMNMPENDEVVQITGGFAAVQEALLQITDRLKFYLFHGKIPATSHPRRPDFVGQMPPFGPYTGRREPSPTRMFPNLPPFQREIGRLHDERSAFAHALHGSGVPPHGAERLPLPWAFQGTREGAGSMRISEYSRGLPPSRIVYQGGNHPAVITNTTVEVVVPRAVVPSIYGEEGYCLMRIREISEAKITITEPRPEAKETVIIISGAPEQTHAAQSLIQAFVLSEAGST